MVFWNNIKNFLGHQIRKLFEIDKMEFQDIVINKIVINQIIQFAKNSHPKEFVAFLNGEVHNKNLVLDNLIYHEFVSSENSAMPIFHFANKSFYGSVHSHPSYNNRPSVEDIRFFRKTGIVHCIICKPYSDPNIKFYNQNGEEISVKIR